MTDEMYTVTDSIHETVKIRKEPSSGDEQSFQGQIRSRLQYLELELSSVLCLLRTRTDSALSNKVYDAIHFVLFIYFSTSFLLLILLLRSCLLFKQSVIFLVLHNNLVQKFSPNSGTTYCSYSVQI